MSGEQPAAPAGGELPEALAPDRQSAFLRAAGLQVTEASGVRVVGQIDLGPAHHTPWGIVHGGVYCAAVESAASIGASLAVEDRGQVAVGLTNTTNFLRSLTEGTVTVDARAAYQGLTHQLWEVAVTEGDRLVAVGQVRLQNVSGGA